MRELLYLDGHSSDRNSVGSAKRHAAFHMPHCSHNVLWVERHSGIYLIGFHDSAASDALGEDCGDFDAHGGRWQETWTSTVAFHDSEDHCSHGRLDSPASVADAGLADRCCTVVGHIHCDTRRSQVVEGVVASLLGHTHVDHARHTVLDTAGHKRRHNLRCNRILDHRRPEHYLVDLTSSRIGLDGLGLAGGGRHSALVDYTPWRMDNGRRDL